MTLGPSLLVPPSAPAVVRDTLASALVPLLAFAPAVVPLVPVVSYAGPDHRTAAADKAPGPASMTNRGGRTHHAGIPLAVD